MTDRELLERAARAAGYQPDGICGRGLWVVVDAGKATQKSFSFDSLNDDGDALRLAVKLNLTVKIMGDHVKVGWRGCGERWPGEEVPCNADHVMLIATRRAITRAAAELAP